ncbi:MAG: response regulator [Massilia sp.]
MILIVDDDEAMAETCSMYLELQGFEVSIASSGAEALTSIRRKSPQLLISDCQMPDMTGVELSEELRADPSTAQLPILLISGSSRGDVAKGSSFDAFLHKPFLGESLLIEVRKLLLGIGANHRPLHEGIRAII